jgi:hypothetical protein
VLGKGRYRWTEEGAASFSRANPVFLVRARGFLDRHVRLDDRRARILRSGGTVRGLDVSLVPPAVVEGVVLGPDGRPVPGATVGLTLRPEERYPTDGLRIVTDGDGSFLLEKVDPTLDWHLVSWQNDGQAEVRGEPRPLSLEPAHGAHGWYEIRLLPVREVELTVSIADHAEGMKVVVEQVTVPAGEPLLRTKAKTGPNRFELKDAMCTTVGERDVEIPADARGFHVEMSPGNGKSRPR